MSPEVSRDSSGRYSTCPTRPIMRPESFRQRVPSRAFLSRRVHTPLYERDVQLKELMASRSLSPPASSSTNVTTLGRAAHD